MENRQKSYLFAFLSVLFWSTSASAFKISLRYENFLQLLLISSLTSFLFLFAFLCFQKKLSLLKKLSRKDIFTSMVLGFFNPFLYYLILFKAYSLIPAQLAQPLNFVWPIMIVLLSIPLLKQKIRLKNIFAIFISFAGVVIISTKGNLSGMGTENSLGIFLALFSSIIWAIFWIFNLRNRTDEIIKLFLNFAVGFLLILIYFLIFSDLKFPGLYGIIGSVYIGLFEMGITFVLWLHALKYAETTAHVNNLIYLTPFLSLIFINFVVGEKILFSTFIGLIFIVFGIVLQKK
ncbi:MAG: EamA/RhaT family transporter [Candidatus Cloacimonadota bacterium]|nr:MAG: EamA/RhaT family transporter [Candidatus Cloacimonadota bacterium]